MQDSHKVSIIITTFNGSSYIRETIESVINQTYKNWELIILDDGSNDNTCEIISEIKDERVFLYKVGRIGINGKVKNIGLTKCSGELIAFIDHDDLWHSEKLEKQVAALQAYPEAGFCLTGGYNFISNIEPVEYFYNRNKGLRVENIFMPIFQSKIAVWTQALLVKNECLQSIGTFNETSMFADPEFIYRLAYHYDAVILYEPLLYHRIHSNSHTSLNWEKCHYDGIEVFKSYRKKKMLPKTLAKSILFRSYLNFGEKNLQLGKKEKAIRSFLSAYKEKPLNILPLKKIAKVILYSVKGK